MRYARLAAAFGVIALAGASLAADRDPLAGRVAGNPQTCVGARVFAQGPQIVDGRTILYRDGRRLWRTGPRGLCPALRSLATLVVESQGGQLCRNDRFHVLEMGAAIPSGSCLFDAFTPYDRVK